ncbi:hypothetical protein BSKO_02690 [Bryopsis sp. KO-2023]|nr:hypothetical protein BSKO_02690 [Bryopsis sp. KO-2023]
MSIISGFTVSGIEDLQSDSYPSENRPATFNRALMLPYIIETTRVKVEDGLFSSEYYGNMAHMFDKPVCKAKNDQPDHFDPREFFQRTHLGLCVRRASGLKQVEPRLNRQEDKVPETMEGRMEAMKIVDVIDHS